MRKLMLMGLIAGIISSTGLLAAGEADFHAMEVVKLTDFTQETLQAYFSGDADYRVLECSEGLSLPVSFFVTGDFLASEGDEQLAVRLRVVKTFYIKCGGNEFEFSTDLSTWQSFTEFFTGQFSVFVNLEGGEPQLMFSAELNQREE